MGIDKSHYHGWQGELHSPWIACLAIVRVALLQVFRRKSFWLVIALGLTNFVAFWVIIYVVTQFPAQVQGQMLEQLGFTSRPGSGEDSGYIVFMQNQSLVVMLLLAFSGSLLVGSDFRLKSLPFYLSRRIDRRHYILGKILAVSSIVWLMTVLPALLLFIEYGMFTSSTQYWRENGQMVLSILGYGLVLCTVLSVLLVTLSAYLEKAAPIAITWSSIFVLLGLLVGYLRKQTGEKYWNLLDPWRAMRYVGRLCFDSLSDPEERRLAWYSLAILTTVCILALIALFRRVRAVDIVE